MQDKKKLALAVIVLVLLLYVDFNFVLKAQTNAIKSLNTKMAKLKADINSLTLDKNMMQRTQGKTAVSQPKRLIDEGEVSWLIEQIYKTSNLYKVKLRQVRPLSTARSAGLRAQNYSVLPINIDLYAGYHALTGFIRSLEQQSVIIKVEELEVRQRSRDIFSHEVKLVLNTYVSKK